MITCGFRFSRLLLLPHAAFCPQPISGVRPAHFLCSPLPQRSSIKVSGKEAGHFLQGLVTNDIGHIADLEEEENDLEIDNELFEPAQPLKKSVYSFFLNTQGRIMFDTIIFRGSTPQEFWIDCDKELAPKLLKHLKMYKVRRKLDLKLMEEDFKTVALWKTDLDETNAKTTGSSQNGQESFFASSENVNVVSSVDPRNQDLGHRAIVPKDFDIHSLFPSEDHKVTLEPTSDRFTEKRYRLGISEGHVEIPFGKCFPLEYNADYLHGVSFQKGCYIGQELTARTYHTGVIRKRIMPILLKGVDGQLEFGTTFVDESEKRVGNLRGQNSCDHSLGLGLMRTAECSKAQKIGIKSLLNEEDIKIFVTKPAWWPQEAPKNTRGLG